MSKLIAKIHILKKELGLDDETYRAFLKNETGKDSAAKCTPKQLHKAISALQGKSNNNENNYKENAKEARYRACYAMWHRLHGYGIVKKNSAAALNAYIARVVPAFGKNGHSFTALTNDQANKAVDTLQQWLKRVENKEKENG